MQAVTLIYDTLKDPELRLHNTEVMAASFRNTGEARRCCLQSSVPGGAPAIKSAGTE